MGTGAAQPSYGGQAVIEGVMMRGPRRMAVVVRRPDRTLAVREAEIVPWNERWPLLRLPVARGAAAVAEALTLGLDALMFSANEAAEQEEDRLSRGEMTVTLFVSLGLAILLFVLVPTWLIHFVEARVRGSFGLNLLEGGVRLLVLGAYIAGISLLPDVRRLLQYHGAEHKVIHAWEAGDALTVDNVRRYPTLHPRCGTSFLFLLALVSIVAFAFTGWPNVWERVLVRLAFLPVIAGVAYEVIRFSGRAVRRGACPWWLRGLIAPGLWFQRLTTREPDDDQIEVAIAAMRAAVGEGARHRAG